VRRIIPKLLKGLLLLGIIQIISGSLGRHLLHLTVVRIKASISIPGLIQREVLQLDTTTAMDMLHLQAFNNLILLIKIELINQLRTLEQP